MTSGLRKVNFACQHADVRQGAVSSTVTDDVVLTLRCKRELTTAYARSTKSVTFLQPKRQFHSNISQIISENAKLPR